MKDYSFDKKVNPSKISQEVQQSSIVISLNSVDVLGDISIFWFKATLSAEDELTLRQIVNIHDSSPIAEENLTNVSIIEVPEHALAKIDRTYIERSFDLDIPATEGLFSVEHTFPYPLALLGGDCFISPNMVGDRVRIEIHFAAFNNNIVGVLTEGAIQGKKEITVDLNSARNFIAKSRFLSLTNGSTFFEEIGEVVEKSGQTILLANALSSSYPAGTFVQAIAVPIPHIRFTTSPAHVYIGEGTHRATYLPANTKVVFKYWNQTGSAKPVSFLLEYYV